MAKGNKWLLIPVALALSACAQQAAEQKLDSKLTEENSVNSRAELGKETEQDLKSAHLTPEKRAKLEKLKSSLAAVEKQINKDSLKLRAVLVKELLSDKYDENEIDTIKSRMWDLENKRLTMIYGTIDKANKILGHFEPQDARFIDEFFDSRLPRE